LKSNLGAHSIKKGFQVYRPRRESWFGDQLLKVSVVGLVSILMLVAVGAVVYHGLRRSVFFQIEEVDIKGCNRTTPRQILAWSGLDVQTNLWTVRIGRVREQLEEQQWIAKAKVDRDWPNELTISIRERQAAAIVSRQSGLHYVDKWGVIFGNVLPEDNHDYPVITGYEMLQGDEAEQENSLKEALGFIKFAGRGSAVLPTQNISEIHIDPDGNLILFIADHPFPIALGRGELSTKYQRLSRVLSWLYRKKKFEAATKISMNYMQEESEGRRNRVLVELRE